MFVVADNALRLFFYKTTPKVVLLSPRLNHTPKVVLHLRVALAAASFPKSGGGRFSRRPGP